MFRQPILYAVAFSLSMLAAPQALGGDSTLGLPAVLAAQPDEIQQRYPHRHPGATLEFFGVQPGMTVVEALPGPGWYSKILVPYLGTEGELIGADYAQEIWPLFGFMDAEFIDKRKTWVTDWPAEALTWGTDPGAKIAAFKLGSMPAELNGTADVVLLVRALHNLARFESQEGFLTSALDEVYAVLKPGGIAGVVQHQARDDMPDEWADGSRGYLKKAFVIARMEQAGFELVGETDVNQNDKDQPTTDDIVWRLPPTLATSRENPELREQMLAVGESNRMTLKFRKPAD